MNLSEQLNSPNMKHWMAWPIPWESNKLNIPFQLSTQVVFRQKNMTQYLPSHGEQLLFATAAGPDAWKTARPDCENRRTSQQKKSQVFTSDHVCINTDSTCNRYHLFVAMDRKYYPIVPENYKCRNLFLRGKDFMKEQNQTMAICGQCLIGS